MTVKVRCTGCQKVLTAPDQARGKAIKCPHCQTRVSVPAGDGDAPPAKKKKAAAAAAPDSESAIASLDLRSMEDTAARVCPKCGYDMTHFDEDTTECPKCGYDTAAGGMGEKARKRQLKGPDPDKFYAGLWKSNWKFVFVNQGLAWRTILYTLITSTMMFGSLFMYLWVSPVPPRAFFALCTVISGMMIPGWLWFLDQEIVKASLERKEKLKRINLDIFLSSALGVKFVVWHVVFAAPLLALPALIGWAMVQFGGMPMFVLPIVVGVCYLPVFSMLPIVIGHMVMPVQTPGWMFWKVVPAWLQVLKPCLLWLLLLLVTCAPTIGCVAAIGAVYGQSLEQLGRQMDHNSAITRAKLADERKGAKDKTKGQDPLIKEEVTKANFFPLIVPGVLWLVGCLFVGFPALYLMRVNGQIMYFFRDYMDLHVLAKEYKYVAKEKVDEEDIKPKTTQEVLVEALVLFVVFLVIGTVGGFVISSLNNEPIVAGLIGGVLWGLRLAYIVGFIRLSQAAKEVSIGYGILVGIAPACMIGAIVSGLLISVSPAFAFVGLGFGALCLVGLIGALVFTVQHWQEARPGCLLILLTIVPTAILLILALAGLFAIAALIGSGAVPPPQGGGAPVEQQAPADGGGVMPANPGAPKIEGQNLPGAEVLNGPAAALWLPIDWRERGWQLS